MTVGKSCVRMCKDMASCHYPPPPPARTLSCRLLPLVPIRPHAPEPLRNGFFASKYFGVEVVDCACCQRPTPWCTHRGLCNGILHTRDPSGLRGVGAEG